MLNHLHGEYIVLRYYCTQVIDSHWILITEYGIYEIEPEVQYMLPFNIWKYDIHHIMWCIKI